MMESTNEDDAAVTGSSSEDAEVVNELDQGLNDPEEPNADQSSEQNLKNGGCMIQAQAHPSLALFLAILCLIRVFLRFCSVQVNSTHFN